MIKNKPFKIAIASGKGGTGKTLLSTNLAAFMSKQQPTLLVDIDVEEPNDFIFIDGEIQSESDQYKMIPAWDESKCTLCGICSNACKFHAVVQLGTFIAVFKELCHSCYACSELCPSQALPMQQYKIGVIKTISADNLTFIESRLEVGEEQAVPLIHQTQALVDEKHSDIQIQIFDCPPGTSCPVIAATNIADFVILVTEPTPFGLNDLTLAVETMRKLRKDIGVVINRYGIGYADVEEYCNKEQIPILAKIPFDRTIAEYYSNGELVYDKVESVATALQSIINAIKPAHKI
ncbi:ATP-binding protein [Williamwhitmania taraxaci]|uniref:MinD superfamily P-loop ATPase, contains an inserted ferredoxin domain n=1 Tax=Williamwhitmania taraxaci TaxID=1640674 RepID=A0A1G6HFJ5_9BACT|nr:ATP-binding protein [Williamwhitmania taraxaci]SDB93010.1 MinD superfamily P-loop ATPase, contains an inserted ferredoxin domain [Williamwhitmania taraxaci]